MGKTPGAVSIGWQDQRIEVLERNIVKLIEERDKEKLGRLAAESKLADLLRQRQKQERLTQLAPRLLERNSRWSGQF
jgi:hypothetical protein